MEFFLVTGCCRSSVGTGRSPARSANTFISHGADVTDEYLRLAEECFAGARTMSTVQVRTALEMADVWTRLAKEQDEAFPPTTFEANQPVAQQQQQVQPKKDDTKLVSSVQVTFLGGVLVLTQLSGFVL